MLTLIIQNRSISSMTLYLCSCHIYILISALSLPRPPPQHYDGRRRDADGQPTLPYGQHEDLPLPDAVHGCGGGGKLQPAVAAPQRGAAPSLLGALALDLKGKHEGKEVIRIQLLENSFVNRPYWKLMIFFFFLSMQTAKKIRKYDFFYLLALSSSSSSSSSG